MIDIGPGQPVDDIIIRLETRIEELEDDMRRAEAVVDSSTRAISETTRRNSSGFERLLRTVTAVAAAIGGITIALGAVEGAVQAVNEQFLSAELRSRAFSDNMTSVERAIRGLPLVGGAIGGLIDQLGDVALKIDSLLRNAAEQARISGQPFTAVDFLGINLPGIDEEALLEAISRFGTRRRIQILNEFLRDFGINVEGRPIEPGGTIAGFFQRGLIARTELDVLRGEAEPGTVARLRSEFELERQRRELERLLDEFVIRGVLDERSRNKIFDQTFSVIQETIDAELDLDLERIERRRLRIDPFESFATPFGQARFRNLFDTGFRERVGEEDAQREREEQTKHLSSIDRKIPEGGQIIVIPFVGA